MTSRHRLTCVCDGTGVNTALHAACHQTSQLAAQARAKAPPSATPVPTGPQAPVQITLGHPTSPRNRAPVPSPGGHLGRPSSLLLWSQSPALKALGGAASALRTRVPPGHPAAFAESDPSMPPCPLAPRGPARARSTPIPPVPAPPAGALPRPAGLSSAPKSWEHSQPTCSQAERFRPSRVAAHSSRVRRGARSRGGEHFIAGFSCGP